MWGVRVTVDFRKLNSISLRDSFPIPRIEECLQLLANSKFFHIMDMSQGYHQIGIEEESIPKTAFITRYGLFQYKRMAQGLMNSPASFQRVIQTVLSALLFKTTVAYLDDVSTVAKDFPEGLTNLRDVLECFRKNGLKLKAKKCSFFQDQVEI